MCDDPTPTPRDLPSPRRASDKALSFAEACEAQATRLSHLADPDAHVLSGELLALGTELQAWGTTPPDESDRQEKTTLFMFLIGKAHEFS